MRFIVPAFAPAVIAFAALPAAAAESEITPEQMAFFENKVRPVLAERCYDCHSAGAEKLKAGFYADSRDGMLQGGDTGPAVVPGDPEASLLIEVVRYGNVDLQMPPKAKLPDDQIAALEEWVKMGAPWPGGGAASPAAKKEKFDLAGRKAEHWSWAPVSHAEPPAVKNAGWVKDPADRFILAKLEEKGMEPNGPAEPRTLVRRLYFDLTGLPPTPEQADAFAAAYAKSPAAAIEATADQLLESPRFGERWARHWLDMVRYAETRGHEFDHDIPNAHEYRDYVIRALNADVPYNDFVVEHIAGDLLESPRLNPDGGYNESILGTGFWFLGEWVHSPVDIKKDEADRFDNMIDTACKAFLGLTVACARCHDHKFDAISTKDYYALYGYLQSSGYRQAPFEAMEHNRQVAGEMAALDESARAKIAAHLKASAAPVLARGADYLLAARDVLRQAAASASGVSAGAHPDIVFADFEDGTFQGWRAEGDAFGERPVTGQTKADYQHDVKFAGQFFVNSHNQWRGDELAHSDGPTGTLTSPAFAIERGFVSLLVGGGGHRDKTCVNLLIDGKPARTVTGRNNNTMFSHTWDVREFRGRRAQIQVVDAVSGGWGNIGIDHVVFSDQPGDGMPVEPAAELPRGAEAAAERLAQQRGLQGAAVLAIARELAAAKGDESHPLHGFAIMAAGDANADAFNSWVNRERARLETQQAKRDRLTVHADYADLPPERYIQDGFAWGRGPHRPGDLLLPGAPGEPLRVATYGAAVPDPDWADIRLRESKPDGHSKTTRPGKMLRTPTFALGETGAVWYLARGEGTAMAVVDSHRMVAGPLHGNVHFGIKEDKFTWKKHALDRYVGHNLHVEFVAADGADLEILMVCQAPDNNMPDPEFIARPPSPVLLETLAAKPVASMNDLAARYAAALSAQTPAFADLIARNAGAFDQNGVVARAVADHAAARAALSAKIQRETRAAPAMLDGTGWDDHVYVRGNPGTLGDEVPRRFLEALGGLQEPVQAAGSGRLDLARQMVDPANPFASRVIVNRVWHHLFGRGIVPTPDDFGVLGQRPTHPELLDHLAASFAADGWSLKRLIKRLVLTQTYAMSSDASGQEEQLDPDNALLHRARVRRLQGEAIRDAILAVSGRLDPAMFGDSVPVHLTDFMTGRGRPSSGPLDGNGRRSIYLGVRRNFLSPMMLAFDTPIPFAGIGRRTVSNVPAQALILMNDPFVIAEAKRWSERVRGEAGDPKARIAKMYGEAFARPPTEEESAAALGFVRGQAELYGGKEDNPQAWADLCHALFNVKEFIFLN